MINIITILVIYYSLFQKKLFNKNDIIKYFPQNVFGIFTSIKRSNKLNSYPFDIHGCIGYWNNDFNNLNNDILYDKLLQVSYDSMWNDDRKNYFNSIENDPDTILELDFMLNPIYNINIDNGFISKLEVEFNNKDFGIIIQTKTNKATYLPNVFTNISWTDLIISIKQKANIINNEFKLYAYKIHQIKSKYIDIFNSDLFIYNSIYNFSRLLIDTKQNLDFPFAYSYYNNKLEWNNEQVRNIATLSDVFKYIYKYKNIATKTEIDFIVDKIFNILNNIDKYSSQSLSFLGYIYKLFDMNNKNNYCYKLLNDLSNAEP